MNKYVLAFIVLLLCLELPAQLIKKNNECIGFGKFILGEPVTAFKIVAVNGGQYKKDGHDFTIYATEGPVELLGTTFNSVLLTFNDSNKLVLFSFIKFYKKTDSPRFEKEAKKYYEQLNTYITGELDREGEKKTYFVSKNSKHTGYEWKMATTLLKLAKSSSEYHSSIQLSFGDPEH